MKNHLLLIIIFLCTSVAIGQDIKECYITMDTHDTLVATDWVKTKPSESLLVSFRMSKRNSIYYLELKYHFGKGSQFSITKGDSVKIKFKSGWGYTVFSSDSVVSKIGLAKIPGSTSGTITQGIYALYPLTIGEIAAMQFENIEKMRIYTSRGFDNFICPEWYQKFLKNAAVNILKPVSEYKLVQHGSDYKEVPESMEKQKEESW